MIGCHMSSKQINRLRAEVGGDSDQPATDFQVVRRLDLDNLLVEFTDRV